MILSKKDLRPVLVLNYGKENSILEKFQNEIVRPIIKLQHSLLLAIFIKYSASKKTNLQEISKEKLIAFVNSSLRKDITFKNQIIGIIVGFFTVEEFKKYSQTSSEINKRIIQIIIQRLTDSYQELTRLAKENQ